MIERKTGQAYKEFMTGLLESVGINQMKIGRTQKKDLGDEEVRSDVPLGGGGGGDSPMKGWVCSSEILN